MLSEHVKANQIYIVCYGGPCYSNVPQEHKCDNCDKIYKTKYALRIHIRLAHRRIEREYHFKCEKCSKAFKFASQLRFHFSHQCPWGRP